MPSRRALTLVIALVVLATPGFAAAGGFAFAVVGGRLVAVGSGSGAVAVSALGMAMGASTSAGSLGPPIPSLLVVEAVPLDAEIMLDGNLSAPRANVRRTRSIWRPGGTRSGSRGRVTSR
jgi:hypothetical protein